MKEYYSGTETFVFTIMVCEYLVKERDCCVQRTLSIYLSVAESLLTLVILCKLQQTCQCVYKFMNIYIYIYMCVRACVRARACVCV
jgi:hypothetical protein